MTREEAKAWLEHHFDPIPDGTKQSEAVSLAIKALEQEPCIEEEPKTGRWIKTIGENGITSAVRCSECGLEDNRYMLFRYCPNCGAKMKEGD